MVIGHLYMSEEMPIQIIFQFQKFGLSFYF